jgi:hypothetical protein
MKAKAFTAWMAMRPAGRQTLHDGGTIKQNLAESEKAQDASGLLLFYTQWRNVSDFHSRITKRLTGDGRS